MSFPKKHLKESLLYYFHYNLYKITPDGKALFLNGGIRGSIETFYVLNGVAYCEYCNDKMEVKID